MTKMTKLIGILGVAVFVLAMATPADANCIPSKTAGTYGNADGSYIYIVQGTGDAAGRAGKFWQPGAPGNGNGTYPVSSWTFVDVGGSLSMQAVLGDAGVSGCPTGALATLVQTPNGAGANFVVMTINETPSGTPGKIQFNYVDLGANAVMIDVPRPRVASSARSGSGVTLTLNFDAVSAGLKGPQAATIMSAYRVVSKEALADPGRNAADWTGPVVGTFSSNGGGLSAQTVLVTCSGTTNDVFIATQLLFDNGAVASDLVSAATRIECDPALADPGKFKLIDKQKKNR